MTMYTRIVILSTESTMWNTIKEAFKTRNVFWFNLGVLFIVLFAVIYGFLPKVLPEKMVKNKKYATVTFASLAIGLACVFISLASGIGFGLGIGNGSGAGFGDGRGVGVGDGNSGEKQKYTNPGELDITIKGCSVYVDAEEITLEQVLDYIDKKATDSVTVVLIDYYSDYGTYKRVEKILNGLLSEGKYERRRAE